MPNYASNRLVLTGPAEEIARFMRECIRVRPEDEPGNAPSLDLDAIVPMPPEIRATCEGATDELRAIALAATGYGGWYDWSCANWGTKWNTSDFHGGMIGDTIYDCDFITAWCCPIRALRTLAAAYPRLRGTVAASEPGNNWSFFGIIRDGDLHEAEADFDEQMQLLVCGGNLPKPVASASVEALLAMSNDPVSTIDLNAADRVWSRALKALKYLGRLVGGDLLERLAFERFVIEVCDLVDTTGKQSVLDGDLARTPDLGRHVEFLLADDRARTAIDRQLLKTLAGCLRSDAMWGKSDSDGYADEIKMEVFDCFDGDDLRDWACLAMFRPGTVLDFSDDETLRAGFLAYADRLRIEMLTHLRGTADADRLPAAA